MVLFVMSGASSLPPVFLRYLGKTASIFIPPLAKLMNIVDTLHSEASKIWEDRKAERKASDGSQSTELLGVLRTAIPFCYHSVR